MGWEFVQAKVKNDVKSLDNFFDEEFGDCVGEGHVFQDEYYRAIREGKKISCVVCYVGWEKSNGEEWFGYKAISENSGPLAYHCPNRILDMLTSTKNKFAKEWREECRKNNQMLEDKGQEMPVELDMSEISKKFRDRANMKGTVKGF